MEEPFKISRTGRYQLSASVLVRKKNGEVEATSPTLDCELTITLQKETEILRQARITSLEPSGQFGFGGTSLYASGQSWLLPAGDYVIQIESSRTPAFLGTHGAVVELTQSSRSVERLLSDALERIIGVGFSVIGLAGMILGVTLGRRAE